MGETKMKHYTKDEILKIAEKENVKYVCMQFSDMMGTVKSVEIPVSQLQKALDNKIMLDGS